MSNPYLDQLNAMGGAPAPSGAAQPAQSSASTGNPYLDQLHALGTTADAQPQPAQAGAQSGPFDALKSLVSGGAHMAGEGLGRIMDLMQRPMNAVQSGITDNADQSTMGAALGHGLDTQSRLSADEQHIAHRADIRQSIAHMFGANDVPEAFKGRGIADFGIDTLTDPLTYLGGLGIIRQGAQAIAPHILPAAIGGASKLGDAAVNVASKFGPEAAEAAQGIVGRAGDTLGGLYDTFNYGGPLQRSLAQSMGAAGGAKFNEFLAAKNMGKSVGSELNNRLQSGFNDAVQGLAPEEEHSLYDALNQGTVQALSPDLQARAQTISNLTDSIAYLSGTKKLRNELTANGFSLPDAFADFDGPARGLQKSSQYRANYVPLAHDASDAGEQESMWLNQVAGDLKARQAARDVANAKDANLAPRAQGTLDSGADTIGQVLDDPEMQRQVFQQRLQGAANAIAGKDTQRAAALVGNPREIMQRTQVPNPDFDPTAWPSTNATANPTLTQMVGTGKMGAGSYKGIGSDAQDFFKDTFTPNDSKNWAQNIGDAVKSYTDLGKQSMFMLPFRHMANITGLQALADPGAIPSTISNFVKLQAMSPEEKYAFLKDSMQAGATGVSGDRANTLAQLADKLPMNVGKPISSMFSMSNKALWNYDDAAKKALFDRLTAQGIEPAQAAREVGQKLVDYGNQSPFTQGLGYVAPFPTWRTKMPVAVATSLMQHPERANMIERLSPAAAGEDQQGPDGQALKGYTPLADATRGLDEPAKYLRSTLSAPAQMLFDYASSIGSKNPNKFMTYGKDPNLLYAVKDLPILQQLLEASGHGVFPDQGAAGFMRGQTGFGIGRPDYKR